MITAPGRTSFSILVADDEPAIRLLIARYLRACGHRVTEAANGRKAWEDFSARGHPPDLVIADLVMPEMGGLELLAALRKENPTLPVLLISGFFGDEISLVRALDRRTEFLQKPFNLKTLATALQILTETAPALKTNAVRRPGLRRAVPPATANS